MSILTVIFHAMIIISMFVVRDIFYATKYHPSYAWLPWVRHILYQNYDTIVLKCDNQFYVGHIIFGVSPKTSMLHFDNESEAIELAKVMFSETMAQWKIETSPKEIVYISEKS